MQTCPSCGARVAAELEWCNQCYVELRAAPAGDRYPLVRRLSRPNAHSWVRGYTRSDHSAPPKMTHEFSRWRAGATSFGPIGRLLLTLAVLLLLVAELSLLRGLVYVVGGMDIPGMGFVICPLRRDPGRRVPSSARLEARTRGMTSPVVRLV